MIRKKLTIFRRFSIVIFSLITVLGFLFILITYLATTYYHEASTQLLNKEVAAHIAKFTSPFTKSGIDKTKADSVFQNAMVLSPAAEVYFLDTSGKVIYFHASEKEIKDWHVELAPLKKYIDQHGDHYIKAIDPKDPAHTKIFSAAEVESDGVLLGYIYVILDSVKSETIMDLLFGSHILNLAIKAFLIIILISFIFSYLYLKRLRRNFQKIITVLERFEKEDYHARFDLNQRDDLQPVTSAFNKMADLLSSSINKLKISEQARKVFIATISHDLRTPLAIARGYTETLILKRQQDDPENYSQLIHNKILQIEKMVAQLFELSKMDAVEFNVQKEPFVLSEIVEELIDNYQILAQEKNIRLQCSSCGEIIWVNADISMIERVIQNLVDNALKNTPDKGSVDVSISLGDNKLIFTIANSGAPVSMDILKRINEVNPDTSPSRQHENPGLGLLIVQKILQLHQTRLKASVENNRNIFSFELPVYK